MFLEITAKDLKNKSVFEYIASSIEKKFPDSKDDAEKVRTTKSKEEVERIFGEYYEGWKFDNVNFSFGDIDTIIYWMDQDLQLYKKELEYKKWVDWLADRGMTPGQLKRKTSNKKSS